ncbi:MAG: polysaccharide biosynthesis C-terminal domain-containing protein, partial [Candidatus Methanoperedens sp.]|nr:polysaccharide biosynthesis C-terminal domain-containing protein [Candidatus Methanoperedens sp.]
FNPLYAENASITLFILTIASLPVSINTLFTAVRNAQKRVSSVVKINAGIAVLTLVFAFPLSRSSGIEGAASAFLAANSIAAIVVVYKMKNLVLF